MFKITGDSTFNLCPPELYPVYFHRAFLLNTFGSEQIVSYSTYSSSCQRGEIVVVVASQLLQLLLLQHHRPCYYQEGHCHDKVVTSYGGALASSLCR